jgi:uncharacterized UPF0146 family protein
MMNKMECEKTDSGAINGPEDDVIEPEIEFYRVTESVDFDALNRCVDELNEAIAKLRKRLEQAE